MTYANVISFETSIYLDDQDDDILPFTVYTIKETIVFFFMIERGDGF